MKRWENLFRKVKKSIRKKKLYRIAREDAMVMCSSEVGLLPPDFCFKRTKEELLAETQKVLHEYRMRYFKEYFIENAGKTAEEQLKEYVTEFMGEYAD